MTRLLHNMMTGVLERAQMILRISFRGDFQVNQKHEFSEDVGVSKHRGTTKMDGL